MKKEPNKKPTNNMIGPNNWVKVGDRCSCILEEMKDLRGEVIKVVKTFSIPYCVVRWNDGKEEKHTITILKKV